MREGHRSGIQSQDEYSHYEMGLINLLKKLGENHPDHGKALTYQQRLTENLDQTRRFGNTSARQADRAEIIARLNSLASSALGTSFNNLCQESGIFSTITNTRRIQLIIKDINSADFDNSRRNSLITILAIILSAAPSDIHILNVQEGSSIYIARVTIEVPEQALSNLRSLTASDKSRLIKLGVTTIESEELGQINLSPSISPIPLPSTRALSEPAISIFQQLWDILTVKFPLSAAYVVFIVVTSLGVISGLVDVFGLPPRPRYSLFAIAASLGVVAVIASLLPHYQNRFRHLDRIIATTFSIFATVALTIFTLKTPQSFEFLVQVEDQENHNRIMGAIVIITNVEQELIDEKVTDSNGIARFFLDDSLEGKPALIIVEASEHEAFITNVNLARGSLPEIVKLEIEPATISPTQTQPIIPISTSIPVCEPGFIVAIKIEPRSVRKNGQATLTVTVKDLGGTEITLNSEINIIPIKSEFGSIEPDGQKGIFTYRAPNYVPEPEPIDKITFLVDDGTCQVEQTLSVSIDKP
jgi:hypothetical protein